MTEEWSNDQQTIVLIQGAIADLQGKINTFDDDDIERRILVRHGMMQGLNVLLKLRSDFMEANYE